MQQIQLSIEDLSIGFIPVILVLFLMWRGQQDIKKAIVSLSRMLLQLILVGYLLLYIFNVLLSTPH